MGLGLTSDNGGARHLSGRVGASPVLGRDLRPLPSSSVFYSRLEVCVVCHPSACGPYGLSKACGLGATAFGRTLSGHGCHCKLSSLGLDSQA